eukprot:m.163425 g.163425  ORF g.163425 m.163425 type:complete len:714 (-) comp15214_c0_seq2:43-2184(-)
MWLGGRSTTSTVNGHKLTHQTGAAKITAETNFSLLHLFLTRANMAVVLPLTIGPEAYREAKSDRKALAAFNRINALACIMSAGRGWLGASFSCTEILTAIYSDPTLFNAERGDVVALGKGHAAAMQYACLVGAGILPVTELVRYELPDGPQAHTDISTPGIALNTGSLGQTLSKALGLAMARSEARVYVVLGDGELQEGQVWEAFMAFAKFRPTNLIIVVDINGIQTDSNVADIMPTLDPAAALTAAGIQVIHVENGNCPDATHASLQAAAAASATTPTLLLMHTDKGAGLTLTAARSVAPRSYGWHGGVPNTQQYLASLIELSSSAIAEPAIRTAIEKYCISVGSATVGGVVAGASLSVIGAAGKIALIDLQPTSTSQPPTTSLPSSPSFPLDPDAAISTGTMYGKVLAGLDAPHVRVLDADLEKSCQLTAFALAHPTRFLEVGAAEQNMVGIAGGLALAGLLPFCNTYANFYRRAIEQVYVNATEHTRVVYAGHYAGLCYATDGKTHQALGDIALFRGVPGVIVLYPCWPGEVRAMLEWYLSNPAEARGRPLYLRLHRTAALFPLPPPPSLPFTLGHGVWLREGNTKIAVLTAGPHLAGSCLAAASALESSPDVIVLSSHTDLAASFVTRLAAYDVIAIVEETHVNGGLFECVAAALHAFAAAAPTPKPVPRLYHRAPSDFPFSTRVRTGLYEHFGLTPPQLAEWLKQVLL